MLGGNNNFQYAPNPLGWVDPLGLAFKPVIFPPNQVIHDVTIKMQGGRGRDFKAANEEAQINGNRGLPTQGSHKHVHGEVTWHHVDYNPLTNEARMQLVTTVDHEAKFRIVDQLVSMKRLMV